MYLLCVRNGEASKTKERVSGQIIKADGSKKEFLILPGTTQKLDFQYGDKVVCVSGSFLMLIHTAEKQVVGIKMDEHYWLPFHEVTLTEEFIEGQKTELPVMRLTGVNHRVTTGLILH